MMKIMMTEILDIEKIPDLDMIFTPETGILERTDIEEIEIGIEKKDIEKRDIGRICIERIDLEMILDLDMIIIILIEIPETDLGSFLDLGMIIIGMIIRRNMNHVAPLLGRMLITLENLEKGKKVLPLICFQKRILGKS